MEVAKDKLDSDISTVKAVHIRAMDFEPFAFRINDDALPELASDYTFSSTNGKAKNFDYHELTEEQHREALTASFAEAPLIGYDDLMIALKRGYATIGCVYGKSKVEQLKKFLENKNMILKDANRKYSFNPKFYY